MRSDGSTERVFVQRSSVFSELEALKYVEEAG